MQRKYHGDSEEFSLNLNDAEQKNANYVYRHHRINKLLGCWRWKGMWQFRDKVAPIVFNTKLRGIDFGGANGPVSLETTVVDFADKDIFGRLVEFRSIDEVPYQLDFVFSSHTLEHIGNLDEIFIQFQEALKADGILLLHLPAYSCKRWLPGIHKNSKFNDHKWAFALASDENCKPTTRGFYFIDQELSRYFVIQDAQYVGDNSIFIIAKNTQNAPNTHTRISDQFA